VYPDFCLTTEEKARKNIPDESGSFDRTSGVSNPAIMRNKSEELNPEHPVVFILLLSYFTAVPLVLQRVRVSLSKYFLFIDLLKHSNYRGSIEVLLFSTAEYIE
jgi:hypothetical protein